MADLNSQWSAAFISWVMTEATRNTGARFPAQPKHTLYAQAVRSTDSGFEALDPALHAPQLGDIIVNRRYDRATNTSSLNLRFTDNPWTGPSHGDIVVEITGNRLRCIGGNSGDRSDTVSLNERTLDQNGRLNPRTFLTILRPKAQFRDVVRNIIRVAQQEYSSWDRGRLSERDPRSFPFQEKYWRAVNQTFTPTGATPSPRNIAAAATATGEATPGISPYIASIESFHPFIQYELTRRRNSAETVNAYMPYVRLTSLVNVEPKNLRPGTLAAYCPSLGVHGKPVTTFDEIYNPEDGRSIVAYATKAGDTANSNPTQVAVVASTDDAENDPPNIPPPGIIGMSTDRSTAGPMGVRGGLFRATINIRAHSLGQVNTLLLYFLRPATRVILEFGRESSSPFEQQLASTPAVKDIFKQGNQGNTYVRELFQKFNWNRPKDTPDGIDRELEPLVKLTKGQQEFIQRYVYNNFGNYDIYIGYVVSFKLRNTKDNVYEIELSVNSVQQFEVPVKQTGTQPLTRVSVPNTCDTIEIMDYFNPASGWRPNSFKQLLRDASEVGNAVNAAWGNHIVTANSAGSSQNSGDAKSPAYFVSWRFFVDVILNDTRRGILSIFQLNENSETLKVLRSTLIHPTRAEARVGTMSASEVAWHPALRSTDVNTMVIYNPSAQPEDADLDALYRVALQRALASQGLTETDRETAENTTLFNSITGNTTVGTFTQRSAGSGTAFLTNGVWLNTNAIIDAFSGTDTVTQALNRLLVSMNNAVQGFWNLQLLSSENAERPGVYVIDMGLSKPVTNEPRPSDEDLVIESTPANPDAVQGLVNRFTQDVATFAKENGDPKYLYVFNRGLSRQNDSTVGSELLDINLESNLPQVIAVQAIAGVGGVTQRGALESIDIDELQRISMYDVYPKNSDQRTNDTCGGNRSINSRLPNIDPNILSVADVQRLGVLYRQQLIEGETAVNATAQIRRLRDNAIDQYVTRNSTYETTETPGGMQGEGGTVIIRKQLTGPTSDEAAKRIQEAFQTVESVIEKFEEERAPGLAALVQEHAGTYGRALKLIEYDISRLLKRLDVTDAESGNPNAVHPFNASNLTKTTVELKLPGIAGIQLFQSFAVARAPNILDRGYYVVTKVKHDFTVENGWVTTLEGRFRYKPDPSRART